jgi:hypothetical protein
MDYEGEMNLLRDKMSHYKEVYDSYKEKNPECQEATEALQLAEWLFDLMQMKRDAAFENLMEFMNDTSQIPRGDIQRNMEYAGDDPGAFLKNAEMIIDDKKREMDLKSQFAEKAAELFDDDFEEQPSVSLEMGDNGDVSGAWVNCWKYIEIEKLMD